MDYKPKIKIIHICLSTSKETTSEKFLIYNLRIIICRLYDNPRIKRSLKPHRVLCETKDHLHRNVTPIFLQLVAILWFARRQWFWAPPLPPWLMISNGQFMQAVKCWLLILSFPGWLSTSLPPPPPQIDTGDHLFTQTTKCWSSPPSLNDQHKNCSRILITPL